MEPGRSRPDALNGGVVSCCPLVPELPLPTMPPPPKPDFRASRQALSRLLQGAHSQHRTHMQGVVVV